MIIYKLCSESDWVRCQREGLLPRSPADTSDGFVHLSTAAQVQETAAKHYRHRPGQWLLSVDTARLDAGALRWEVSRGGDRFPHLYADLSRTAVTASVALSLDERGVPVIPAEYTREHATAEELSRP